MNNLTSDSIFQGRGMNPRHHEYEAGQMYSLNLPTKEEEEN
jgi:hypothetical protein